MASFRFPALDSYSYRSNVFSFPAVSGDTPPPEPIEISGAQTGTLAAGVYHVTGDLLVETGTSWTISAGCQFLFMDDYEIYCQGQVQCLGTSGNRITFGMHPDATATQWGGFACSTRNELANSDTAPDTGAEFKWLYCDFSDCAKLGTRGSARSCVRGAAIITYNADYSEIDNCTFTDCVSSDTGGAVYYQLLNTATRICSESTFTRCVTNGGQGGGFACAEASMTLNQCVFTDCEALVWQDAPLTADAGTDIVTVPISHLLQTGAPVTFNAVGTLPSPLVSGTKYAVIVQSTTTIKIANNYADAVANTPINLTTNGSGFEGNAHQDWYIFAGTLTIT